MIKTFWTKLNTKQRYLAVLCGAAVLAAFVLEVIVFPLWDARSKMKKSILNNSTKLEEMIRLDAEFAAQDAQISRIKNTLASRRADFTLFAYLEKKAIAARVKGSLKQMNSVPGTRSPSFEETLIDLRLEKITVRQLADFLYQVETPAELVRIKRITINKMKESPDYIGVQLLIASYAPVSSRSGGP